MTAMAWQPQEEPLRQLSTCLKDSLSGHNKNAQKQAEIVRTVFPGTLEITHIKPYECILITSLTDACSSKIFARHQ
jgi:transportin-1